MEIKIKNLNGGQLTITHSWNDWVDMRCDDQAIQVKFQVHEMLAAMRAFETEVDFKEKNPRFC